MFKIHKRLVNWFKRTDEPDFLIGTMLVDFETGSIEYRTPKWIIEPVVEWRDFWVGVFIDAEKRRVYILPLPCLGLRIYWG